MAISRKPKITVVDIKESKINKLIKKGGSIADQNTIDVVADKTVLIRLPLDMIERIDNVVKAKKIKTPRHTWLLEAVFEKLEREE